MHNIEDFHIADEWMVAVGAIISRVRSNGSPTNYGCRRMRHPEQAAEIAFDQFKQTVAQC
jgi:hypothetical protein